VTVVLPPAISEATKLYTPTMPETTATLSSPVNQIAFGRSDAGYERFRGYYNVSATRNPTTMLRRLNQCRLR
jgi:hypothetical protein